MWNMNLEEFEIINWAYDCNKEIKGVETISKYNILEEPLMGDAPKSLIVINGDKYIVKTGHKWYPIESITEHLLNQLGNLFGLNMAESKLAIINGQLRFLSKYFLKDGYRLIHGAEIFSAYLGDSQFVWDIEAEDLSRSLFTMQLVEKSIRQSFPNDYQTIIRELVKLILFDALVGNNDRHYENWAVITDKQAKEIPEFSPVYDTARGLFWNYSDEMLTKFSTEQSIKKYVINSKPKLGWENVDGKKLNHFTILEKIFQTEFYISKLEIRCLFRQEMFDSMIECIKTDFANLLSNLRIEKIIKCLDYRYSTIKSIIL